MGIEERISKLPPERQVEVIDFVEFLLRRESEAITKDRSIQRFLEDLAKKPRKVRSKEELDRDILDERNAWDAGK